MMNQIEKSITVNSPVRQVFNFVSDPGNLMKVWHDMIEVTDIHHNHNGGRDFQCVSRMAGTRIQYANQCVEYVIDRSIAYKISGGLHGAIRWQFDKDGEQTRVKVCLEYQTPDPLLKRQTESAVGQQNQYDVEWVLNSLKSVMEGQRIEA